MMLRVLKKLFRKRLSLEDMLGLNGIINKNFPKCNCCKKKLVPLRVRIKKKIGN